MKALRMAMPYDKQGSVKKNYVPPSEPEHKPTCHNNRIRLQTVGHRLRLTSRP